MSLDDYKMNLWGLAYFKFDTKEEFVGLIKKADMWGNPKELSEEAKGSIEKYLSDIWDALYMSIDEICERTGMDLHDLSERIETSPKVLAKWREHPETIPYKKRLMMVSTTNLAPSFADVSNFIAAPSPDRASLLPPNIKVKTRQHWEITASVSELLNAGIPIDLGDFEDAGIPTFMLPSITVTAFLSDIPGEGPHIHFYYSIPGEDRETFAFSALLDISKTPQEMIEECFITVVSSYVSWSDVAKLIL